MSSHDEDALDSNLLITHWAQGKWLLIDWLFDDMIREQFLMLLLLLLQVGTCLQQLLRGLLEVWLHLCNLLAGVSDVTLALVWSLISFLGDILVVLDVPVQFISFIFQRLHFLSDWVHGCIYFDLWLLKLLCSVKYFEES